MIDDYDLFDQDFEEFLRRGREAYGLTSDEPEKDFTPKSIVFFEPENMRDDKKIA